ncbi:hypothetical protein C9374_011554 [Naegleria lovaniensis]|uniref:Uncharacterized protein n=1 Tax=Naegleria lovaniensis TaxID=51637 RepID=A0AA88KRN2_NAELO|nr:uncharacterized protein C9374_011554 [Naegleria lovaniensis]KAG2392829.1 hypothetical protein C9374_011554 [Naegleria lovaniensis]
MSQQQQDTPYSFRNLLLSLDPTQSKIERIAHNNYHSDLFNVSTPQQEYQRNSLLDQWLMERGIYGIKSIICRTSRCYVLTESNHLLEIIENSGIVEHVVRSFLEPHEKLIQMSAGYAMLLLVVQDVRTLKTRVFTKDVTIQNYAANTEEKHGPTMSFGNFQYNLETVKWNEILDFKTILDVDEHIIFTSCAAYSITFISNKGRIFASGSNQFCECAQPNVSYRLSINQNQVKECRLDPYLINSKPFFIRSVNGDHTIIALTNDHRVFYCGYCLNTGSDQDFLQEFNPKELLDSDEHFVDIASCYYSTLILSNKHRLYCLETRERVQWSCDTQTTILSCRIFAAPYVFFMIVNDSLIFTCKPKSSVSELKFKVFRSQPSPGSHLTMTGGDKIVIYWKSEMESKSIQNMKEKMMKSLKIDFLQDITVVQL